MIKENGTIVKCPKCGSTNVIRVHPFDYWKQCKDCKHEFMTGVHN
jgi:ribosomal protein L37AE/L43A